MFHHYTSIPGYTYIGKRVNYAQQLARLYLHAGERYSPYWLRLLSTYRRAEGERNERA